MVSEGSEQGLLTTSDNSIGGWRTFSFITQVYTDSLMPDYSPPLIKY